MAKAEETRWVDLTTEGDKLSDRRRFVKSLGVTGPEGIRAVRVEVVTEQTLGAPPEDIFSDWFNDWLEGN